MNQRKRRGVSLLDSDEPRPSTSLRPAWGTPPFPPGPNERQPAREPLDYAAVPLNTLITADTLSRGALLAAALGRTPSRVHVRKGTEDLRLNDVGDGVLVLHEINALSREGQESLFQWMEEMGSRVRIISLAEGSLYDLVEQRRFRADLYYRLCVVHMV